MVGTDPRFNAAAFRSAIKNTMRMAAPADVSDRATFRWRPARTYTYDDPASRPYNWTATPVSETVPADVQVDVAVEFTGGSERQTALGQFDASKVTLTLLDEDYEQVRGADEVLLGGNTYEVDFVAPPIGLFDVTVYQVFCSARDES